MKRKLVVSLAIVIGLMVLLIAVVAASAPSGSVATSDDGTHTVELALLDEVPIAGTEPLVEAPNQYLGVPHPEPGFDTTELGVDLSLNQDTSALPELDPDRVLRAVYLGHDVRGEPYYIWQSGSPDLRRLIGQIVADFGAVGRLGSSYGGLNIGDALWENARAESIAERGLPDGSFRSSSNGPTVLTLEWHGLPTEVVAVVIHDGAHAVGWQRPVSGTVAFQFEIDEQDPQSIGRTAEMVALSIAGDEWSHYSMLSG